MPLTPEQIEALQILQEECAEVIQAVSKILRHGLLSTNPTIPNSPTNGQDLDKELGHVIAALKVCRILGLVHVTTMFHYGDRKLLTSHQWIHYIHPKHLAEAKDYQLREY
jgi:hypothetical protein